MIGRTTLALVGALAGVPALADFTTGDALVIGNARYGDQTAAFGPTDVQAVAQALRLRGQEVVALANAGHDPMTSAFDGFTMSIAPGETPLIVVLSGAFAMGETDAFLLPAGRVVGAALPADGAPGLSLSAVMDVLAQSPRRAFLVLGEAALQSTVPTGLTAGLTPDLTGLAIPQGVTVIHGAAADVAQFAAGPMAHPGERLARTTGWHDLEVTGYMSQTLVMLDHTEVRPPTADEQTAALSHDRQAEDRAWQSAREASSPDAVLAYLDSYPDGVHTPEARALAETALALTPAARQDIQRHLSRLGYPTRGIDGIFGPVTRASVATWQERIGQTPSGYLDSAQIATLALEAAAAPAPRRQTQTRGVAALNTPPVAPAASPQETAIWSRSRGEQGLRNYLSQFPNGRYADRARVLISNIQRGVRQ